MLSDEITAAMAPLAEYVAHGEPLPVELANAIGQHLNGVRDQLEQWEREVVIPPLARLPEGGTPDNVVRFPREPQ